MPAVSFHASAVQPEQVSAIMADYLALEHVRVFRRLLVIRCGLIALAIAIAGAGFGWLTPLACWVSVGIVLLAPVSAWVFEQRRSRQLARRLEQVPTARSWTQPCAGKS
jgi:Flp pilus assembly protein TadB